MDPRKVFGLIKERDPMFGRRAIAKLLGIKRTSLDQYYTGASSAMSDLVALNCANYFDIPPELMIYDQQYTRANSPDVRQLYVRLIAAHPHRDKLYQLRMIVDPYTVTVPNEDQHDLFQPYHSFG